MGSKTYKKKDTNLLEVTDTVNEIHVTEEDRASITNRIVHYENKIAGLQVSLAAEQDKLDLLDA